MCEYTAKDYKKGQPRWCPGCGDHFFLASLHKAMAEIGKAPWENAVISYNYYTNKIDKLTYSLDEVGFSIVQTFAATHK